MLQVEAESRRVREAAAAAAAEIEGGGTSGLTLEQELRSAVAAAEQAEEQREDAKVWPLRCCRTMSELLRCCTEMLH